MAFEIIDPKTNQVPILISVPHCGTGIPSAIRDQYDTEMIQSIDDTDWFVDQLYDFVDMLGIKMVKAKYSRWVIDLNRATDNTPLYQDGRVITALCPTTNFNNKRIYKNSSPTQEEINQRISSYYYPYYDQVRLELTKLQRQYKHVLFFDAHSIRQYVPGIQKDIFPDLILGDVDGKSADTRLTSAATDILVNSGYTFKHNHPFKGGNLTRTFGQPQNRVHGLQLEMAKTVYMNDRETMYDTKRASRIRTVLHNLFETLIITLNDMNR
ncbi:N-formylglutamate amidohydrolase [Reichenbachiella carrageenanivorans]|uniref:N-formylglutamate amidohydrolase n=1 Tax=Reichenbachiella carrageenanivorans TaxID=2979869 RepID=A0ABY6D4G9_9BACT|nr:N-formylglutamate amidohydrolase [Reichenbachiella carrageenanivorans]UXX80013.1 N-formylglutamate amidohydrolase [Reichenbachiella carrageenanivorans]